MTSRSILPPALLLASVAACASSDKLKTNDGPLDSGTALDLEQDEATDADTDPGPAEVRPLDPDTLAGWFDDGEPMLLVNVHTPYAGEIAGTDAHVQHRDTDALVNEIGPDLDRRVVLYCRTGPMSADAAGALAALGYREIWDLQGGMNAWQAAGHALE